jgi:hypothetical protein
VKRTSTHVQQSSHGLTIWPLRTNINRIISRSPWRSQSWDASEVGHGADYHSSRNAINKQGLPFFCSTQYCQIAVVIATPLQLYGSHPTNSVCLLDTDSQPQYNVLRSGSSLVPHFPKDECKINTSKWSHPYSERFSFLERSAAKEILYGLGCWDLHSTGVRFAAGVVGGFPFATAFRPTLGPIQSLCNRYQDLFPWR